MHFSKFLVTVGATVASAASIPSLPAHFYSKADLGLKQSNKIVKRGLEDAFKLEVQNGVNAGKCVVGLHETTAAFLDCDSEYVVTFSIGTGGVLDSSVGRPGALGFPDNGWVFYDDISPEIIGCSLGTGDILSCTTAYDPPSYVYGYNVFGVTNNYETLVMANSTIVDWNSLSAALAPGGEEITLKAIAP
ncbi:hypothetical protein TWF506_003090 [Arthrobotrys conoides]|uniref:Uncharacterized protein n=1 Tax=Arthrobotrys conoides TaxID=74498 RepID=A0AAN8P6Y2_9PEZI